MKRTIHCIGDSHTHFFTGSNFLYPMWPGATKNKIPLFKTYFLGPVLAYNLQKESVKGDREKLFSVLKTIEKENLVLLSFGELDCRLIYLMKHITTKDGNVESMIEDCLEKYFSAITEIRQMGYQIILWGVSPVILSRFFGREKYPDEAKDEEINLVEKIFDKRMKEMAKEKNIPVVSILEELLDKKNIARKKYFMDGSHISQRAMPMVIKKIRTLFPKDEIILFHDKTLQKCPMVVQNFLLFLSSWIKHFWFKTKKASQKMDLIKRLVKTLAGERSYQDIKRYIQEL